MKRISATFAVALCALACVIPATATAGRLPIPPNQPEADEYTESVPDGEGNSAPDRSKDPRDILGQVVLQQLDQLGETGSDVAILAASTAPGRPGSASRSAEGSAPNRSSASPASAAEQVGNVRAAAYVPSEDGLRSWLWVIVVAAVVSAALYACYLRVSGRRA